MAKRPDDEMVLDLIDADPAAARLALGVIDVHRSLATIALPPRES